MRGSSPDRKAEPRCSGCRVRGLCVPGGVALQNPGKAQDIVSDRRRVPAGKTLYRAGDALGSLYVVRLGSFKTSALQRDGREQVIAFPMSGELLGMDAIAADRHITTAVALEDSEVCVMPYSLLERIGRQYVALQREMSAALSREIARARDMMMLLGSMGAEERVAMFLSNLSARLVQRGYSPSELHLRMSRGDIASFLGIKLETVCRMLGRFRSAGLMRARHRHVRIVDLASLERTAGRRL